MRFGIAIELILLAAGFARADQPFAVENRCPTAFVVTDKTAKPACSYCTDCKCAEGKCPGGCPVAVSWFAAPFAHKHPTPPGYPAAPAGFHWAQYPGGVWGLVQDGLSPPKAYSAPVQAVQQSCPTGACPLNRR